MDKGAPLPVVDGVAVYRLVGDFRFRQVVERIAAAIDQAYRHGHTRFLVDVADATGFDPPSLADRHWMVRQLAEAAQGKVRGAMVVRPAFIDPQKFGVVAAANFGLVSNVFQRQEEAMA